MLWIRKREIKLESNIRFYQFSQCFSCYVNILLASFSFTVDKINGTDGTVRFVMRPVNVSLVVDCTGERSQIDLQLHSPRISPILLGIENQANCLE